MTIGLPIPRADWATAAAICGDALSTCAADLLRYADHAICGVRGHDMRLQFEPDRLFLRCARCGHASPGWEIGPPVLVRASRPSGSARRRQRLLPAA